MEAALIFEIVTEPVSFVTQIIEVFCFAWLFLFSVTEFLYLGMSPMVYRTINCCYAVD